MRPAPPDGRLDRQLQAAHGTIAGVDEAGRGALAGPVTVAAVVLDPAAPIAGLDDSKRLSPPRRRALAALVRIRALAFSVVHRDAAEIDRVNILEATRAAMLEAVSALAFAPGLVVSDAVALPGLAMPVRAEVRADARYLCVAAASILAKVARDELMVALAGEFPHYGWVANKGYPTPAHLAALSRIGPCRLHRRSFGPVRVLA
ncbi:MAG TPA: ribonuclease HII [Thermoanaerobaculaceae bacterium]|nr:ribonuclease HII [Thermoanaerobaculaceae bacterium]